MKVTGKAVRLIICIILVLSMVKVIPASAKNTATVNATSLKVRSEPNLTAKQIGSLKNGEKVTVYKTEKGWANISFKGVKAWVSVEFLKVNKPTSTQPPKAVTVIKQAKVTAASLNVRKGPGIKHNTIGSLKNGTVVTIQKVKGTWSNITYGKLTGWVSNAYLLDQSPQSSAPIPQSPSNNLGKETSTKGKWGTVTATSLNFRSSGNVNAPILGSLKNGTAVQILNVSNGWSSVQTIDGKKGWVSSKYISVQSRQSPIPSVNGLKGKRIVIDPGHGGHDPGTTGKSEGTHESGLTLISARLLATELSKAGATVILTRSDSSYVSLSKRVEISHYHFADAFISLHYNSADDRKASGILTFYYGQKDVKLADSVHQGLLQAHTGLPGGNVRFGNFYVLRENKQPAILVELGFLSNPFDEMTVRSNSFQSKAVTGITNGLTNYFR